MNSQHKLDVIRHSFLLSVFALGAALLIGLSSQLTRDRIDEQRRLAEGQALEAVLPSALHDNDLTQDSFLIDNTASSFQNTELLGLEEPARGYLARIDGTFSGVILPGRLTDGYSGTITFLVGITNDGSISGVRILDHRETPGLGDKIELQVLDWILGFEGKSLDTPPAPLWTVSGDGGAFDQFIGATITPRAVVKGVRKVLEFYRENRIQLMAMENP